MRDKVAAIISDVIGIDASAIRDDTGPGNCEKWDSLAQVVMISRMADELGIDIPFDKMMEIECAGDLFALAGE